MPTATRQLLDVIASGDRRAAERAMKQHVEQAAQRIADARLTADRGGSKPMATGPTVVITDSDLGSDADEQVLRAAGCTTVRLQAKTEDEVVAGVSAADPDALVVQWARVSGAVLDAAPRCRFISRLGIGYDMIDVAAATERGVAVANTPDYCVDEVVSHTLAMALWLLRGLGRFDAAVAGRQWSATKPWPLACRPSAAAIGVVGLGRIGSRVARQAARSGSRCWPAIPTPRRRPACRCSRSTSCCAAVTWSRCTLRSPTRPGT